MRRTATFDESGLYRYRLSRRWAQGGTRAAFVMLNPSTADARRDDPTIRRCIGFAQRWGCAAVSVVNLFALRATHPPTLFAADDPVGPDNDRHIRRVCRETDVVVAAWGVHGARLGRDGAVLALLEGLELQCLGTTRGGHPLHPLYVRGDAPLVPVPRRACAGA